MLRRHPRESRKGTTVVECAVVYPATILLLLSLIIGGMGIFRYQEVASLARAGARYGSTHGAQFRKDTQLGIGVAGSSSPTSTPTTIWYSVDPSQPSGTDTSWSGDIYDQSIRPNQVSLDVNYLQVQVGWPPVVNQPNSPDNWPGSRVSVKVTYLWLPELLFIGPITLSSTSTMPISN